MGIRQELQRKEKIVITDKDIEETPISPLVNKLHGEV